MIGNSRFIEQSVIFLMLTILPANALAVSKSHIYATGNVMEVDRCASAWLIKRFVDKQAVFKLYPEEEIIIEGIVFDRPEARLQRSHNQATFEVIMEEYGLEDAKLRNLAAHIHDIEINFWGAKENPESRKLATEIEQIIKSMKTSKECLQASFTYFDQLYEEGS